MRCRWCDNDTIVRRPACTHCGEEMPEPRNLPDPADAAPAEAEPSTIAEAWKSVGVALVMFLALVVGGRFAVTNWPKTYEAPETETAAATGVPLSSDESPGVPVDGLLAEIQGTRSKLPGTLGDCATVASDLPVLREVTEERRAQARTAADADFGAAPDADALRGALVEMTRLSLVADEEYIRWADDAVSTGTCSHASADGAVTSANTAAEEAKQAFVELWNATAQTQGGPTYTWTDF
ncbi:hypothetical protein [Actinomadura sediminis]|uniref:Uncharacterized protein n=1 Tax=Actinomadura sediminis TaxID=1038904 RepID=A0ABW3EPE8_9ACTN